MDGLTVYVLHLDRVYQRARHYTGLTGDVALRLYDHRHNGNAGARLLRNAYAAGVETTLVLTVHPATRVDEIGVKESGIRRWCPLCGGEAENLPPEYASRASFLPEVTPRRRPRSR